MNDADSLVANYLKELDKALAGLPRTRRREVVDEIAAHIAAARAEQVSVTDAEIRNLLDRVGEPADIAADARERFGVGPDPATWREFAALVLLPIGGVIVPVLGWLVGVVLLWASNAWTRRDKLIGTFVLPGGLLLPFAAVSLATWSVESCSTPLRPGGGVAGPTTCTGGGGPGALEIATMVLLLAAPIASALYLARRMGRTQPQ
jgi:hypothetical protein